MNNKQCKICLDFKLLKDFIKDNRNVDGRTFTCRVCYEPIRKKYYNNYQNTLEAKYKTYIKAAKERNLSFNITIEEFKTFWQLNCFYCNIEIKTIGLDRVDNSTGYELKNIVPCCRHCNYMKHAYSAAEFYLL